MAEFYNVLDFGGNQKQTRMMVRFMFNLQVTRIYAVLFMAYTGFKYGLVIAPPIKHSCLKVASITRLEPKVQIRGLLVL